MQSFTGGRFWLLPALTLAALLQTNACVSTGDRPMRSGNATLRPPWCDPAAQQASGSELLYVGASRGQRSQVQAEQLAESEALARLAREVSVEVRVEQSAVQVERNGQASAEFRMSVASRSAPIELRSLRIARRHVAQNEQGRFDACVEIAIPRAEKRRLQRAVLGKTLLSLSCARSGEQAQACAPEHLAIVKQAASDAGLRIMPNDLAVLDAANMQTAAESAGAAQVLRVQLRVGPVEPLDDAYFVRAFASADLYDALDGKIVQSVKVGPVKFGEYAQTKASRGALRRVCVAIAQKISDVFAAADQAKAVGLSNDHDPQIRRRK